MLGICARPCISKNAVITADPSQPLEVIGGSNVAQGLMTAADVDFKEFHVEKPFLLEDYGSIGGTEHFDDFELSQNYAMLGGGALLEDGEYIDFEESDGLEGTDSVTYSQEDGDSDELTMLEGADFNEFRHGDKNEGNMSLSENSELDGTDSKKVYGQPGYSCWKRTKGRGWGKVLTNRCEKGQHKSGLLCYPPCKEGYKGVGPVCWQSCPQGFRDHGAFCRKPRSYGRGVGKSKKKCERKAGVGNCQKRLLLWYPKCKPGYHNVGCCICSPNCQNGQKDIGISCAKKSYGRGFGKPLACREGEERNGLLCYPKCGNDMVGRGPVCWAKCPPGLKDCGAFCSASCARDIIVPVIGGLAMGTGLGFMFAAPIATVAGAALLATSIAAMGAGGVLIGIGATGVLTGVGIFAIGTAAAVGGTIVGVVGAVAGTAGVVGFGVAGYMASPCGGAGAPLLCCALKCGVIGGGVAATGGAAAMGGAAGMLGGAALTAASGITMLAGGSLAVLGAKGSIVGAGMMVMGPMAGVAGFAGAAVGTAVLIKSFIKPLCPLISEVTPEKWEDIPEWDRPGVVTLYSEPNFKGREYIMIRSGTYNWCRGTLLIGNGNVRSVKVPPGCRVTLFENATILKLCGETEVLTEDAGNLRLSGRVSGVKVELLDPRQRRRFPDVCNIGSSKALTKTVTVPVGTQVPAICGPDCRRNPDKGPGTFKLQMVGNQLTATRTDLQEPKGWGMDLKVACRMPVKKQ